MEKWKIAIKLCRKMIKIKENKLSVTHYIPLSSKRKIKKLEEEIHVYIMMYSSYADSLQIMFDGQYTGRLVGCNGLLDRIATKNMIKLLGKV